MHSILTMLNLKEEEKDIAMPEITIDVRRILAALADKNIEKEEILKNSLILDEN